MLRSLRLRSAAPIRSVRKKIIQTDPLPILYQCVLGHWRQHASFSFIGNGLRSRIQAISNRPFNPSHRDLTRNIMVASCGVVLWFATGQMIMLVWGLGYVVLNTVYVGFLRQQTFPVRPVHLAVAIVASMVIVFRFGGLVVYLSSLGEGEFRWCPRRWFNFCAFNGVMPGGHRAVCETVFSALCISCRGAIRTCPLNKRWRAPAFLGSGVPILADCERCFGSSGRIHLALCRANRALRIGRKSRTSTGTGPHCGKWQGRPELTRRLDASRPRSDRPLRGPVRALHPWQGYRRAGVCRRDVPLRETGPMRSGTS